MKIARVFDRKLLKFIVVGLINTALGSTIMFLLYNIAGLNYWISSFCNYFFTSILSFFLNKYFTFGIKEWNVKMIIGFVVNILFCYFIAYGIAKPAMNYFLQDGQQKIRENAALFVGMCLFTGLNYLGQRLVVFKKGKVNEGTEL